MTGDSPPQVSDISAGLMGTGCLCSRSYFIAGEYADSFGSHSLSLCSRRQVGWFSSKIKVMSPSGAKVRQLCLQPVISDLLVLNLEFFRCDAIHRVHTILLGLSSHLDGYKGEPIWTCCTMSNKALCFSPVSGVIFLEAKHYLTTESAPYIFSAVFFNTTIPILVWIN